MVYRLKNTFFFFLIGVSSYGQNNETTSSDSASLYNYSNTSSASAEIKSKPEFAINPTIGLGTGMFSFYGDVYAKHFQAPMVSRIGFELSVSQKLTDYLEFNFYELFGKLGANERIVNNNRNLNFESQIRAGGLNLLYNFDHLLAKERTATPYISVGVESFEFLSKTDLFDKYGNKYNYWSDGTIRNIAENDPNAGTAIEIHRDYTYESDIREMNEDGFGKYPERSWAIPIGVGAIFKISVYWTFKLGTTMHFTFTDYIDGVSSKSTGNRAGDSKNDKFMMTSFSIHYNFGNKKKEGVQQNEQDFSNVDFLALESDDQDQDGVLDTNDSCQSTPPGVPVDVKGCPIDDDEDGVPNYKDDELATPKDAFVDEKGVQLSDSVLAYRYSFYLDSTGAFAKIEYVAHNNSATNNSNQKEYAVKLGTFKKGLPADLMTKFLSINDIASASINDSNTIYTAGKYNSYLDAEKRKQQLINEGIADAQVVYKQNGKYYDATKFNSNVNKTPDPNINTTTKNNASNPDSSNNNDSGNSNTAKNNINNQNSTSNLNNEVLNTQGVVLRVQLGAYKNRLSKNVFRDINNLIEVKTEDGLYKYMTGSFQSFDAAAKYKVEMVLKGYSGAFITAYKDGKRIALQEAGATPAKKEDQPEVQDNTFTNESVNSVNKKLVVFKIQVGAFKNDPPEDKLALFATMKNIKGEKTPAGITRYTVGAVNDYNEAQNLKSQIAKEYGITDAFIIAFFNGEYISIPEALELLK